MRLQQNFAWPVSMCMWVNNTINNNDDHNSNNNKKMFAIWCESVMTSCGRLLYGEIIYNLTFLLLSCSLPSQCFWLKPRWITAWLLNKQWTINWHSQRFFQSAQLLFDVHACIHYAITNAAICPKIWIKTILASPNPKSWWTNWLTWPSLSQSNGMHICETCPCIWRWTLQQIF